MIFAQTESTNFNVVDYKTAMLMLTKLLDRIKEEKRLMIILIAAVLSCVFVPAADVTAYIDTDTIGLWFSFMAISEGLRENGVTDRIAAYFTKNLRTTRTAAAVMVFLTFFSAPFINNMAAVTFFVPVTSAVLSPYPKILMYVLAFQTAAANLGSIIFPAANPCCLTLYKAYGLRFTEYLNIVLPYYVLGMVLLGVCCLFVKSEPLKEFTVHKSAENGSPYYIAIYLTLLVLVLFSVIGTVSMLTVFASVCVVAAIMEPGLFSKIDYTPLILITAMFIFTGNFSRIRELTSFLTRILSGQSYECNILFSQLAGSLPSTMFFRLFGHSPSSMIISAVISGLGLPAASFGGLYTVRFCRENHPDDTAAYPLYCTAAGLGTGAVLYLSYKFIFPLLAGTA